MEWTARGVDVRGDVDLAWVLQEQGSGPKSQWLAVTGTNGKSTTVRMLESMLTADGRRAAAVGNIGTPIVEAVTAHDPPEVLAVELSSLQLARSELMRPVASIVLNIDADHLDWHGSLAAYAAAKGRIHDRCERVRGFNAADPRSVDLALHADAAAGSRVVGVTTGTPAPGQLGVVEDLLVDRAYVTDPESSAVELAELGDVVPFAPHNVFNALAAACLARAVGAAPDAVREGLRAFRPEPHRIAEAGRIDGVRYIDDSKATNPHAAAASLRAFPRVVWIAGGLGKGVDFDQLVAQAAPRLVGVVLIGTDREAIARSLQRHAPQVPVIDADDPETSPMHLMRAVVSAARRLAEPDSIVLLAPACASMDRFRDYHERGEAFTAAVREAAS